MEIGRCVCVCVCCVSCVCLTRDCVRVCEFSSCSILRAVRPTDTNVILSVHASHKNEQYVALSLHSSHSPCPARPSALLSRILSERRLTLTDFLLCLATDPVLRDGARDRYSARSPKPRPVLPHRVHSSPLPGRSVYNAHLQNSSTTIHSTSFTQDDARARLRHVCLALTWRPPSPGSARSPRWLWPRRCR